MLEITGLAGQGLVDAATLADWNRDTGQQLTTAERAWADPSWAYGHVIVDEAQELSAMAWRMVMRRIPTRSLTVVGDVAQRGSAAGARSWAEMLDPYVRGRWREELLTVNYRTPAEIMAVAADVLADVAPGERPPESVRDEGASPRAVRGLARAASVVAEELAEMGAENGQGGRLAVIAPGARIADLARAIPAAVPGDRTEVLDSPVALLTVGQSKGLEFDRVVLVDPAGILASPRRAATTCTSRSPALPTASRWSTTVSCPPRCTVSPLMHLPRPGTVSPVPRPGAFDPMDLHAAPAPQRSFAAPSPPRSAPSPPAAYRGP